MTRGVTSNRLLVCQCKARGQRSCLLPGSGAGRAAARCPASVTARAAKCWVLSLGVLVLGAVACCRKRAA